MASRSLKDDSTRRNNFTLGRSALLGRGGSYYRPADCRQHPVGSGALGFQAARSTVYLPTACFPMSSPFPTIGVGLVAMDIAFRTLMWIARGLFTFHLVWFSVARSVACMHVGMLKLAMCHALLAMVDNTQCRPFNAVTCRPTGYIEPADVSRAKVS